MTNTHEIGHSFVDDKTPALDLVHFARETNYGERPLCDRFDCEQKGFTAHRAQVTCPKCAAIAQRLMAPALANEGAIDAIQAIFEHRLATAGIRLDTYPEAPVWRTRIIDGEAGDTAELYLRFVNVRIQAPLAQTVVDMVNQWNTRIWVIGLPEFDLEATWQRLTLAGISSDQIAQTICQAELGVSIDDYLKQIKKSFFSSLRLLHRCGLDATATAALVGDLTNEYRTHGIWGYPPSGDQSDTSGQS